MAILSSPSPMTVLNFTRASLDPRVTFTRVLNTATRVNMSGYVETINADLPRFDYDPVSLACNGLLIEEPRTNLALQSQICQLAALQIFTYLGFILFNGRVQNETGGSVTLGLGTWKVMADRARY